MTIIISPRYISNGQQAGVYTGFHGINSIADIWGTDEEVTAENYRTVLDDPNAEIFETKAEARAYIDNMYANQAHIKAALETDWHNIFDI